MSNDKTKRELNEVVEMHRKALEELAEAIEQRNEARRAAEHWKAQCQKGFNIAEIIQQRNMLAEALRPFIDGWSAKSCDSIVTEQQFRCAKQALAAVKELAK